MHTFDPPQTPNPTNSPSCPHRSPHVRRDLPVETTDSGHEHQKNDASSYITGDCSLEIRFVGIDLYESPEQQGPRPLLSLYSRGSSG